MPNGTTDPSASSGRRVVRGLAGQRYRSRFIRWSSDTHGRRVQIDTGAFVHCIGSFGAGFSKTALSQWHETVATTTSRRPHGPRSPSVGPARRVRVRRRFRQNCCCTRTRRDIDRNALPQIDDGTSRREVPSSDFASRPVRVKRSQQQVVNCCRQPGLIVRPGLPQLINRSRRNFRRSVNVSEPVGLSPRSRDRIIYGRVLTVVQNDSVEVAIM